MTTRDLVKEASHAWMEAWKARDEAALDELLDREFILVGSIFHRHYVNREEWLDMALRRYELIHYQYKFLKIHTYPNLAVVTSHLTIQAKPSIHDEAVRYLVKDVWRNDHGQWRVVSRYPVSLAR